MVTSDRDPFNQARVVRDREFAFRRSPPGPGFIVTEDVFYKDKIVRASDRAEWIVSLNGSTLRIRSRVGAGLEPVADPSTVRLVSVSGLNGEFRNIAALELPAKLLGRDRFKAGNAIELASTFFSHCHAYRVDWKGKFTLRGKERGVP